MNDFMMDIKEQNKMNTWSQLPWDKKMKMIDNWTLVIIVSNILHIFGLMMELAPANLLGINFGFLNFLMGMGTFLIWISLLKYFQYSQDFYILPETMLSAGQIILAALVSAIPIIVGIAFYCMTEFGFVWRFSSLDNSIIMLWSIMNGDEL